MKDVFIHKTAIVESDKIGSGTRIWAYVHILSEAVIGNNANVCDFCFIENDINIGDDVTIKSGVYLWDGITIEDNVFIGPAVTFTNDTYPRSKHYDYEKKRTILRKGSSIGANSTILPGIEIGKYSMVGAGSVVTKNVNDFTLVYGNPAVEKGFICVCTKKLVFKDNLCNCPCGRNYTQDKNSVRLENNTI